MKRTEWLQETRKMRFEEAYEGYRRGSLTQAEAALLLGVCDRTFRRYMNRYDEGGLDALLDKRFVQISPRPATWVGTLSTFMRGTGKRAVRAATHGLKAGCKKPG